MIKHGPEIRPVLKDLIPCLHFSESFKNLENLGGVKLKHLLEIQNTFINLPISLGKGAYSLWGESHSLSVFSHWCTWCVVARVCALNGQKGGASPPTDASGDARAYSGGRGGSRDVHAKVGSTQGIEPLNPNTSLQYTM